MRNLSIELKFVNFYFQFISVNSVGQIWVTQLFIRIVMPLFLNFQNVVPVGSLVLPLGFIFSQKIPFMKRVFGWGLRFIKSFHFLVKFLARVYCLHNLYFDKFDSTNFPRETSTIWAPVLVEISVRLWSWNFLPARGLFIPGLLFCLCIGLCTCSAAKLFLAKSKFQSPALTFYFFI